MPSALNIDVLSYNHRCEGKVKERCAAELNLCTKIGKNANHMRRLCVGGIPLEVDPG